MNLTGKTALVTGANTGIGRVTAVELAKMGARVILACRSEDKTRPVLQQIGDRAEFMKLDLADLASVRAAAESFLARNEPLTLLVNNAGLAGAHGQTRDGFELAFGTNHMGHYVFTRTLLPALEKAEGARVVNVASHGHYRAPGIDWEWVRQPSRSRTAFPEYCVSKLANVLFSNELARRYPKLRSYSLHPGAVASDVWREVPWGLRQLLTLFMLSNEEGAKTTLHCATSDAAADQSGLYFDKQKPKKAARLALDVGLAKELWERSASWAGMPS
jgi:NAD(P)-dependent dehydrogenase (short-subunit alcohol dehydrogenase family)